MPSRNPGIRSSKRASRGKNANPASSSNKRRQSSNRLYIIIMTFSAVALLEVIVVNYISHSTLFSELEDDRSKLHKLSLTRLMRPPRGGMAKPDVSNSTSSLTPPGSSKDTTGAIPEKPMAEKPVVQDRIRALLEKANIPVEDGTVLPTWSQVSRLYGDRPIVYGLDTCRAYRESVEPAKRMIGPAGMFNTGTNLVAKLLENNCVITERMEKTGGPGMRWQVPWGKHTPASWRLRHVAETAGKGAVQKDILPVVTVKDPLTWMGSMCRHSYAANWAHGEEHCPNLVANEADLLTGTKLNDPINVNVRYNATHATHHTSLVGLWNDWYEPYYNASYPRLMIRFEDVMFHPEEVVRDICECGGGDMKEDFWYQSDSAKGTKGVHKDSSGLISAIQRYGDEKLRMAGFSKEDVEYARDQLRTDLMEAFGYSVPQMES